jgi:hypothetical protein
MDKEVVVNGILTDEMIEAGANVLNHLDRMGVQVDTAFWYYYEEPGVWRLVLSSPEVDLHGPLNAYSRLMDALSTLHGLKVPFQSFSFLSPTSFIVEPFRGLSQDYVNLRTTRWVLNGKYVDDAYIYRLPPSEPAGKKARRKNPPGDQPAAKPTTRREKAMPAHA